MSKAIATTFDYSTLDKDLAAKLQSLARDLVREFKKFGDAGLSVGEAIHAAHELLAGGGCEGKFKPWCEDVGLSTSHAYDLKNTYERSLKYPAIGHFPPTVAGLLSAPSVPAGAIKEAAKRSENGERATVAWAKGIIGKFKELAAPKADPPPPAEPAPAESTVQALAPGDCPKGGDHEFDKEACKKCHEPKPPKAPSGGTSFDPSEWTADTEHTGPLKRVFETAAEFGPARQNLVNLKKWLNRVKGLPGGEMIQGGYQRIISDLNNLDAEIKFAQPFAVCCYCEGNDSDECKACKGMKWLSEVAHKAAPGEKKRAKVAT